MQAVLSMLGEWAGALIAFGVLPYIYFSLAAEVHKDYAELMRNLATSSDPGKRDKSEHLLRQTEELLHIFDLDWWIVAAIGVLLLAIFCLSELALMSTQVSDACGVGRSSTGQLCALAWTAESGLRLKCEEMASIDCQRVKNILSLYTIIVGAFVAFRLGWARVAAARHLRYAYSELRLAMPTKK